MKTQVSFSVPTVTLFLLLIYISIQCILKAFSSPESQWTSPECATSLDGNSEPSGSVCHTAQSISGEQAPGSDQCTGMRDCAQFCPHSSREVQQSHSCRIPLFPLSMNCVWDWQRRLELSSFPRAAPTSCWDPSPCMSLEIFSASGLTPNRCWAEWVTSSAPTKHETALNFSCLNPLLAADLVAGWRGNNNFVLMSC